MTRELDGEFRDLKRVLARDHLQRDSKGSQLAAASSTDRSHVPPRFPLEVSIDCLEAKTKAFINKRQTPATNSAARRS